MTGLTQEQFCDEIFDACRHFINWDFPRVWKETRPYANQYTCKLNSMDDNWYQITPENCPENYGFNAIPLSIPPTGQTVTIEFCGEADKNGFHTINADKAGWRYGIVTITKEGKAVYGEMKADPVGKISYAVPENSSPERLWFIVMGAASRTLDKSESGRKGCTMALPDKNNWKSVPLFNKPYHISL